MKKFYLLKRLLLSAIALMFSLGSIQAQCDDFQTFDAGSYYASPITTPDGWTAYPVNIGKQGSNHSEGIELCKEGTNPSYITSPVFNNGCSSINFKYRNEIADVFPTDFKVEIKQEGESVWYETIISVPFDWTEFSVDNLNIEGEFQLVITNLGDTNDEFFFLSLLLVKDICLTNNFVAPPHNYTITAPKDATVFVGDKDQGVEVAGNYLTKHYVPFTEKEAVAVAEDGDSKIWYYNLPAPKNGSGGFNYRITRAGKAPHVGLFKPREGTEVPTDKALVFTDAQLSARGARDVDHDVNSLAGRNVADMFFNINAQGYLTLPLKNIAGNDTVFRLVHTRNWQAIDSDVNNYFIEPDFHYTVVNERGEADNTVVTVSGKGEVKPAGEGTAIVLVTYDAMLCHHTANVGIAGVSENPAFFSALWGENTGVFVVTVGAPGETGIKPNMFINEYWNEEGLDKVGGISIDAEHDVLYYADGADGFPYTFTPEGVSSVLLAKPSVGETALSYSGFGSDGVTDNGDGSWTVTVTFGRNIVKLVSEGGNAAYQVINAKPVTWTVSNATRPGEKIAAGDEAAVLFSTLYHPSNKMSGIYNMSAGIQYTGEDVNFPLILGPGQYTFASRAQEYKIKVPEDFTGSDYTLTNGVIKVRGFGSTYGAHRKISIQNGVNPNLNASVRTAFFGSLPDIHIPVYVAATGVTLDKPAAGLEVGETVQLTATVAPENATDKTAAWTSDDETVATVDEDGLVTAVAVGEAVITATATDGGYTAACTVTVVEAVVAVTGVTLNQTEASLKVSETVQLTATVEPENATNQSVTWASSDETVATVDGEGLVTAVASGEAVITATTVDGEFTTSCTVTVSVPTGVEDFPNIVSAVYPTLTTGLVRIVVLELPKEPVYVMDMTGKVIQAIRLQSLESTIDLSGCTLGMYLIRIGKQTVKVVKQ